jgi:ribonuclease HII
MAVGLPDLTRYERRLHEQGFRRIAGADEAGRGALAGPMFAAAVVLPEGFDGDGIADSKALTRLQREACYERILRGASAIAVRRVTPAGIDRRGLHRCNLALLRRAVRSLPLEPDYVLTDGWPIRRLDVPALSIKKGDAVTLCVAAASIVAKVERDRAMERYHRRFPEFGFNRHRGYGTAEHWAALRRHGPTPIHRLSFNGVANPWSGRFTVVADDATDPDEEAFVADAGAPVGAWDDGGP